MTEYVSIFEHEDEISVCLYNEVAKVLNIGDKMNDINEEAYMNGHNWEAFFNYYLEKNAPDILEDMDTDPEAGMYTAFYDLTEENKLKAEKLATIICSLIENEEELYRIIREEGSEIEWD